MSVNRIVETAANMSFGGWHKQFSHRSAVLDCDMNFALYLPPQVEQGETVPVLYWLSGLTCNHENFMQKAGAQKLAAELGIAIVAPDTSPRGEGVADDEAWDLGQGAGFYLNATEAPWKAHYQMYDYIVHELPALLEAHFPVSQKRAISGHSMGGHGALTIALKNPDRFSSVSAFCPIANPIQCPWGQKAFSAYLGADTDSWRAYDTVALLSDATASLPTLVDQGQADQFLQEQLGIDALAAAAAKASYPLTLQRHEHYDHSYYFVASFVEAHLQFHARYLRA